MPLSEKQIEEFEQQLLDLKNQIEDRLRLEEESLTESTGELTAGLDNHLADIATELHEKEKELAIESEDDKILDEIDEALYRIESGTYGICVDTGEEIPLERLQAIPYAKRTVDAQHAYEKKQKNLPKEDPTIENKNQANYEDSPMRTFEMLDDEQDAF